MVQKVRGSDRLLKRRDSSAKAVVPGEAACVQNEFEWKGMVSFVPARIW